jgi:hypothetical protein
MITPKFWYKKTPRMLEGIRNPIESIDIAMHLTECEILDILEISIIIHINTIKSAKVGIGMVIKHGTDKPETLDNIFNRINEEGYCTYQIGNSVLALTGLWPVAVILSATFCIPFASQTNTEF